VEYLPQHEFLELLSVADAVLDPPGFGGGNSSYEALGIGVPVVTMPGAFMRGRVTLGCYRQMGFEELIAGSAEQYVEIAVRLASDAGFRERCRARIMEGAHRLFEDATAVRELEAFFEKAVDDAAAGALGP
jgi:predicted O-linked N-acetylglucosamine transferase (SPINDLY family)